MKNFKIGDKVVLVYSEADTDESRGIGEVLFESKGFFAVKWPSNETTNEYPEDLKYDGPLSNLEEEFKALVESVGKEIDKKVQESAEALNEACRLAEQHGIPFYSSVSHISQNYVPNSFPDKFGHIDPDFVQAVTEVYNTADASGWEHSAVC